MQIVWNICGTVIFFVLVGWVLARWLKSSDEPFSLVVRWIITAVFIAGEVAFAASARDPLTKFVAVMGGAFCGIVFAILWAPSFIGGIAGWFTALYDGGDQAVEPAPFYSIANAKRKRGNYQEAIAEVEKQLALFPEDYEGLLLIAEIQAEDLHDLVAARETHERILAQPNHAPANIAFVLGRQADWHLKFNQDPDAARTALERVTELLPDTEQAQLANQRLAHLATRNQLQEQKERAPIAVKRYEEKLGLQGKSAQPVSAVLDPASMAAEYVRQLQDFPSDNDAREKLAMIYAEHYQRLDLATGQLEQLIAAPNQQPKQIAHWLNLRADLEIKMGSDLTQARATLQRVADLFPETALAQQALSRMSFLKLENRPHEKSQVIRLGSYEQNIGLKER